MSFSFEVSVIVTGLSSLKLKTRNDSLDNLNLLLKTSPTEVPVKAFSPILDAIITIIESEKTRYEKTRLENGKDARIELYENRLGSAAYTLRLFVERNCERFKPKHIKLLSMTLFELMTRPRSRSLITSVADHLTYSLVALCGSPVFQCNFELHQWISLSHDISDAVTYHLDVSYNDKIIANLLQTLLELFQIDTIGIEDIATPVVRMTIKYLTLITKENTNTRTILTLVNSAILRLHLIRFQDVINLSYYTIKHLLRIKLTNENNIGEIARFNLMISEVLYNKTPIIVGEDKDQSYVNKEKLLPALQDYLIHSLKQYDHTKFTLDCVTFIDGPASSKFNWYSFSDICQNEKNCLEDIWLYALSLTMMLKANYQFLEYKESSLAGGSLLFKRRKVKDTFAHMLKDSLTYDDFLCNCIDSDSIKIKTTGLHIGLLYLSIFDCSNIELSHLKEELFRCSQDVRFMLLCLSCFIPMCSQSKNSFSPEEEIRLFKMCVPLLKTSNGCKTACSLLYKLIEFQLEPIKDKSVLQQMSDLYLLSDVNGPALVCNESFKFWMHLHYYAKTFQTVKSPITYVFSWLYARWDQLFTLVVSETHFYVFASWLCGCTHTTFPTFEYSRPSLFHDTWMGLSEERASITGFSLTIRTIELRKQKFAPVFCEEAERVRFMYKLFDLIDESAISATFIDRAIQVLRTIESLVGQRNYTDYLSRFKEIFLLSSSVIDFGQNAQIFSVMEGMISLKDSLLRHIIMDILPTEKVLSTFMQRLAEHTQQTSHQDEFLSHHAKPEAGSIPISEMIEIGFEFALQVHSVSKAFDPLSSFILYSKKLSLPMLNRTLPNLITYLENNENEIPTASLERLTQFLGSSLLAPSFDTSSTSMKLLTRYLEGISKYWVMEDRSQVLTADCNDIFDWIVTQYDESSFSGVEALYELARFMTLLLEKYNLSNSSISGGKQRVFKILSGCITRLPKYLTNRVVSLLGTYVKRVGVTNQRILFKELLQRFNPPQESVETAAFFSLTCTKLSLINEFYLLNSILHLLDNTNFSHLLLYVEKSLDTISTFYGLCSKQDLFHQCRYFIIDQWFTKSAKSKIYEPSIWKVELFEFEFDEFCIRYQMELTSFFFAKSSTYYYIIDHLKKLLNLKQEALLTKYIAPTIALSYVDSGVKDLIFDIAADLLGRKFPNVLTINLDDVIYYFIKLSDLSNLATSLTFWCKIFNSSRFTNMLHYNSSNCMQLNDNVAIAFPIVYKVLKKNVFTDIDDGRSFEYVIQRLVMDLQNCVLIDQKIRVLRQIKLLVLFFEHKLTLFKDIDFFLLELSKFLFNADIFSEVYGFILDLLEFSANNKVDVARSLTELMRFCFTVTDSNVKKTLFPKVNPVLFNFCVSDGKQLYATCYALLTLETNSFGWNDIAQVFKFQEVDRTSVSLLSDLFDNFDYDGSFDANLISPTTIQNLISIPRDNARVSDKFRRWLGNILGEIVYTRPYDHIIPHHCSTLDLESGISGLLQILWVQYQKADDISLRFLLDHIQSIILQDESVLAEISSDSYSSLVNLKNLTDISWEKFENCHGMLNIKLGETFLTLTFTDRSCHYQKWISAFICNILLVIVEKFPSFRILALLCDNTAFLHSAIISQLIKILLVSFPKQRSSFLSDILNIADEIFKTEDRTLKMEVITKVFSIIRGMALNGVQNALYVYDKIKLQPVIPIMLSLGSEIWSLMIYEEFYGEYCTGKMLDYELLYQIYSKIDEKDLFYGLPLSSSLASSLTLISKTKFNSYTNFALSNGRFEEGLRNKDSSCLHEFASVTSSNGFTGLATMLDSNFENPLLSANQYSWALKLNKWDLPIPEARDSFAKSAFSILKDVKEIPDFFSFDDHILKVMDGGSLLKNSQLNLETMESLGLLVSLKKLGSADMNTLTTLNNLRVHDTLNADYLPENVFDILHWSRHFFIESKINNTSVIEHAPGSNFTLQLAKILNLVHASTFCRDQGRFQDLINIVMTLEAAVDDITNNPAIGPSDTITLFCKRISTVESARMLWANKESAMAINMLEDLLQTNLTAVNVENVSLADVQDILMPDAVVDSQLVEWSSFSRHRSPDVIFNDHILYYERDVLNINEPNLRSSICYTYAEFCYKQSQKVDEGELLYLKQKIAKASNQLQEISSIYKNPKLRDAERKEAKRHHNRLSLQNHHDKDRYNKISSSRIAFVSQALHFFLTTLVHSNSRDAEVVDKFCSLWFSYSTDDIINSKLQKEIGTVPSFKFLPWVSQMASKLADSVSPFQDTLQLTLKRMLYKLPYETLYPLISMSLQDSESKVIDPVTKSRVEVVNKIIAALDMYDSGRYGSQFTRPVQAFCSMSVALACHKIPPKMKFLQLDTLNIGKYWLETLPKVHLPLPTLPVKITCSQDGRREGRSYISSIDPKVLISSSGLSLPKIATFTVSDGTRHRVLLKGSNDDLRQDAIMEQVFKQVNKILKANKTTRKQNLSVRTYEVIPLGPRAGLIEFVANSMSLHDILLNLHCNDEISFDKARKTMKAAQNHSVEERVLTFSRITEKIKPQLRRFFFQSFVHAHDWYESRNRYTKSVVTSSIVGYLLGLGDRHLNNILIDIKTGEPIHIDLGVAFDQGKLLPIPELVPFRLTRDIVDGFGVAGIEGLFRNNCERVFKVLQDEKERLLCVLNVLKWDPLYSWKMTPLKKQRLQAKFTGDYDEEEISVSDADFSELLEEDNNNDESIRALKGVESKLYGDGLSVEAIVQELLSSATDKQNLATIYMGWSPFY